MACHTLALSCPIENEAAKSNMAGDKTFAELEADVAQKYAKRLQDNWKREQKLIQYDSFRGSKYPPFNIEHLPHERQRLSTPMTAEDRVLRKQWLHDQHLSPNEPVNVPELKPRNFIRRLYGKPWDALFKVLRPVIVSTCYVCIK